MPVHAHMWSIPTTSLRGTVPRAWKPRGMTHVSRESRSGGAGLIASVCDRRAHSALFNPSNNPVASVVLSWFCKGRWILEKIMNLSQRSQESNNHLQEFSVLWRSGMDRRVRALFSFRGTCSSHAALGQLCSQVLWGQMTNLPLS